MVRTKCLHFLICGLFCGFILERRWQATFGRFKNRRNGQTTKWRHRKAIAVVQRCVAWPNQGVFDNSNSVQPISPFRGCPFIRDVFIDKTHSERCNTIGGQSTDIKSGRHFGCGVSLWSCEWISCEVVFKISYKLYILDFIIITSFGLKKHN